MGSGELARHFSKWTVCGSIRRQCETVKDIDIVAIRRPESEYKFGELGLEAWITGLDPLGSSEAKEKGISRYLNGSLIKRFQYKEISVDLYLADQSTFETLKLIRTGSAEHNIRLTTLAMSKNLKLKANGTGLVERNDESKIIENTEDGILMALLGRIPKPEQRGT